MVIKHKSFLHGWHYIYRLHINKSEQLLSNGFSTVNRFLNSVFDFCPDEYFLKGPRSSKLKFKIGAEIQSSTNHEVIKLARLGLDVNDARFKSNHSKVQVFMLENDLKTIAVEVPLWLTEEELIPYQSIFGKDPLTGHIDVLRFEEDKVWVWDYKPNAINEKFAATQTYFYSVMLSKRSGIPLEKFRCGYFDSAYAFTFNPNEVKFSMEQERLINLNED